QGTEPYSEESLRHPINAYGTSKLAGETVLQASGAQYLIVRTQWLFGVHGKSFPGTMWERARAGRATQVVCDQTGRPTYAPDLAAAVWRLIGRGACGVMHVANQGEATWFDVAAHVFVRAVVVVVFEHAGRPLDVARDGLGVRGVGRVDHRSARVREPARDVHREGEVLRIARQGDGRVERRRHLGVGLGGKRKVVG